MPAGSSSSPPSPRRPSPTCRFIIAAVLLALLAVVGSTSATKPGFEIVNVENDEEERPVASTGHSLVTRGNSLWLFGGIIQWENGEKVQYGHVLWTYEPEDNTWDRTFAAKGPSKTYKVNDTVHVEIQGAWMNARVTAVKPSESLVKVAVDIHNKTAYEQWIETSKLRYYPPAMNMHVAGTSTTTSGAPIMYIQGGKGPNAKVSSDVWIYFFGHDTWSKLVLRTPLEPSPREMHAGVLIDRGLFIFGGVKGQTCNNDQFFLNFKDAHWKRIESPFGTTVPPERWGHKMALTLEETDGHLTVWMFGGHNAVAAHNELWSMDWATKTWTFHGVNGTCHTHGAKTLRERRVSDVLEAQEAAKTSEDATATSYASSQTTRRTHWPPARKGHSMVLHKGYLIVFGGHGTTTDFMKDLWMYRISDGEWLGPIALSKVPPERNFHSATVLGKYMYLFGGNNGNGLLDDFWRINVDELVEHARRNYSASE